MGNNPRSGASPETSNGDGILDLVVANSGSTTVDDGTVTILLGNGDGTFTQAAESPLTAGYTPISISEWEGFQP